MKSIQRIAALGLLPMPAAGAAQTFAPCQCQSGPAVGVEAAGPRSVLDRRAAQAEEEEDKQVVNATIKYAEARRLERQRQRQ